MPASNSNFLNSTTSIDDWIEKLEQDVGKEIRSINSQTIKQRTIVDHYELQKQINNYYFYKIWIVDDIKLREDGTVKLKSPNSPENIEAVIVTAHETGEFTIRTATRLIREVYYLSKVFDPTFILTALQTALSQNPNNRNLCKKILNGLQSNEQLNINDKSDFLQQLNDSQKRAVKLCEEKEISLIWGPPGTGKTYTLSEIIYRALKRDQSILVLSTSNVAIDQVLLYLDKILSLQHKQLIRRLGATDSEICNRYIKSNSDLSIQEQVVFSTLANAALKNEILFTKQFDLVIVDEASMVSFPYAILASLMAHQNIVFAGDFQQLPPISLCENTSLSKNVFDHLKISKLLESQDVLENLQAFIPFLALLDTQYRMMPEISNLVSSLFYNNRLKCGIGNTSSHIDDIEQLEFIDIDQSSNYYNSYYSVDYKSYYNPITLALFNQIQESCGEEKGILFVTPYRAQQNLVSYYIVDSGHRNHRSLTIHKSQGTEADIVVFDLTTHVKTNQSEYAKILISESTKNLINVAISRAKSKLIIIGSLKMIKDLANSQSLWRNFHEKINQDFVCKSSFSFLENLPQFNVDLANEKVIFGIFNHSDNQFLPSFIESTAEKKIYFSRQQHSPGAGITFRRIRNNDNLPDLLTWGEDLALLENNSYFFLKSSMTAQVLRRVTVGNLMDGIEAADGANAFSLLCENCGQNKIVVHDFNNRGYYLKCVQCHQRTLITKNIANNLKAVYHIKCPTCFADMVPRQRNGSNLYSFYGCSNYPQCTGQVSFNTLI